MKLLMLHNYYQQPGGEDLCLADESKLLRSHGHSVLWYTDDNRRIDQLDRLTLARATLWNSSTYRDLARLIATHRPDIVHVHNIFPLISPSAYYVAQAARVPVVQSVHNFRMFCVNGTFTRSGKICKDCTRTTLPWPGVVHRCYRGGLISSLGAAAGLTMHKALRTHSRKIDLFIVPSEFVKRQLIECGIPLAKVRVKPNFVPGNPRVGGRRQACAVFVGRLSQEKGLPTLLAAWRSLAAEIELKVVGDGPLRDLVRTAAAQDRRISFLGRQSPESVLEIMQSALCVVIPSECYESFGRVAIEAFSVGTPVIAAQIGALPELVEDGRTGFHFPPGDACGLRAKLQHLYDAQDMFDTMSRAARSKYETEFTASRNYRLLVNIYSEALKDATPLRMPVSAQ
ncbi:MAG TPA: glycosyltransferase [Stellaceae bacterium]|nr:glycosyltransferase [Stellaceae bacterium]